MELRAAASAALSLELSTELLSATCRVFTTENIPLLVTCFMACAMLHLQQQILVVILLHRGASQLHFISWLLHGAAPWSFATELRHRASGFRCSPMAFAMVLLVSPVRVNRVKSNEAQSNSSLVTVLQTQGQRIQHRLVAG
jgi:hypothetical protein